MLALVDHTVEIILETVRLGSEKSEVQRLISDNSLVLEMLGWSPQVTFEDGLQRTFEWFKRYLSLYSKEFVV
jgi:nucleoside-diphosphate-sugar epimerase